MLLLAFGFFNNKQIGSVRRKKCAVHRLACGTKVPCGSTKSGLNQNKNVRIWFAVGSHVVANDKITQIYPICLTFTMNSKEMDILEVEDCHAAPSTSVMLSIVF